MSPSVCLLATIQASVTTYARRPIDEALAEELRQYRSPADGETRMFYEIVIAPGYTEAGLAKLKGKSKTLRILEAKARPPSGSNLRQVQGEHHPPKVKACRPAFQA